MSGHLEIRLLGGLQILLDNTPLGTDVPIRTFISNKVPALFAYLAVTKRAPKRDALAALLRAERSDADAKNTLRHGFEQETDPLLGGLQLGCRQAPLCHILPQ